MMSMMLVPIHARFTFDHPLHYPRFASCTLWTPGIAFAGEGGRTGPGPATHIPVVIKYPNVHSVLTGATCLPTQSWAGQEEPPGWGHGGHQAGVCTATRTRVHDVIGVVLRLHFPI